LAHLCQCFWAVLLLTIGRGHGYSMYRVCSVMYQYETLKNHSTRSCQGIITILWAIAWSIIVSESPATHPTITKEELTYLSTGPDQFVQRVNHI
jgi:hypothetical protein